MGANSHRRRRGQRRFEKELRRRPEASVVRRTSGQTDLCDTAEAAVDSSTSWGEVGRDPRQTDSTARRRTCAPLASECSVGHCLTPGATVSPVASCCWVGTCQRQRAPSSRRRRSPIRTTAAREGVVTLSTGCGVRRWEPRSQRRWGAWTKSRPELPSLSPTCISDGCRSASRRLLVGGSKGSTTRRRPSKAETEVQAPAKQGRPRHARVRGAETSGRGRRGCAVCRFGLGGDSDRRRRPRILLRAAVSSAASLTSSRLQTTSRAALLRYCPPQRENGGP